MSNLESTRSGWVFLAARVTTSLRRAWWPGRARHTASLCGHETPAAGANVWMLKDPSEDPGPSRLATPAERHDAGLDDLPQWERDLLTSPDYLRRAAERHDAGLPEGPS